MTQYKITNTLCGIVATAVASTFIYQGACEQMDLSIQPPSCQLSDHENIEPLSEDTYYRILTHEEISVRDKVTVLHNFVSDLVENTQDLNPEFSASVDKYFWDLI